MTYPNCKLCHKTSFPIPKNKKYRSYTDLLFDRKVANIIDRSSTRLAYRDTQERLDTLKAKIAYSKRIDLTAKAKCNSPWYYPSKLTRYPQKPIKYFY